MRPWRIRLTVRRSRVQWALLSVVLLVSVLASTMLSSLFLLSSATERFAAREALVDAPDSDLRVTHSLSLRGAPEEVVSSAESAAEEYYGTVPFESRVRLQGGVLGVPREEQSAALGYFLFQDGIENDAVLDSGRWPSSVPGSTMEATVPVELLDHFDLSIGESVEVYPYGVRRDAVFLDIVGSYEARDPEADFWRYDPYDGQGHTPDAPVPYSGGRLTTDGYGPLIIPRDEFGDFEIVSITIDYVPDFSETTLAEVEALVDGIDDLERDTTIAVGAGASTVTVITRSDSTLGSILGSLAVTRSSVLVIGLLLLVLAVAALGQTSRLMSERRHAEQHLMIARGASGRQLIRLGLLEALVLAAVTTAAGPPLANVVYRFLSGVGPMEDAGMNRDPGLPTATWVVSGIVGLALLIVLITPLLRRGATFVEGEQARSRPSRATMLQRSGLDLALLVLAVLAYLQLRGHDSPIITQGGVAQVDPITASGPALALLAGSLLCVRLIPAGSRFLEGVASRGRRAIGPLAAWEVGRRSARAVSAILLLTLAISVGAFSLSYLHTWRISQEDQASFLHPPDVEVSGLDADILNQYRTVSNTQLEAEAEPVFEGDGEITASRRETIGTDGVSGRPVHLFATTNDGLEAFTDGRVAEEGGAAISEALMLEETSQGIPLPGGLTEEEVSPGIPLAGEPNGVEFTLTTSSSETALEGVSVTLRVLVRDPNGAFTSLDAGTFAVDGEEHTVRVVLPDGIQLSSPSYLVGLQTLWFISPGVENDRGVLIREDDLVLDLSIDGLASLTARPPVPVPDVPAQYDSQLAEIPEDISWYGRSEGVVDPSLAPRDDQAHIHMEIQPTLLLSRTVSISQGTFPFTAELPVVATQGLLNRLGLDVGDRGTIEVDDVVLAVHFVESVPLMPGDSPRSASIAANYDNLQVMFMQTGAPSPEVTSWWVDVPKAKVSRYLDAIPDEASVTTRTDTVRSLRDDPLRVSIQASLWLVTAAAIILAALGFAVHTVVTIRSREFEFAQLRAVGLPRGALTRLISTESLLLAVLGTSFGLALGVALGYLVAPLIAVGPDGRPPVPGVLVHIPWEAVGLRAAEIAVVLLVVVSLASMLVRRINPAALLRVEG